MICRGRAPIGSQKRWLNNGRRSARCCRTVRAARDRPRPREFPSTPARTSTTRTTLPRTIGRRDRLRPPRSRRTDSATPNPRGRVAASGTCSAAPLRFPRRNTTPPGRPGHCRERRDLCVHLMGDERQRGRGGFHRAGNTDGCARPWRSRAGTASRGRRSQGLRASHATAQSHAVSRRAQHPAR
jgi:hypothetical protein